MKKITLLSLTAFVLALGSCSKDDSVNPDNNPVESVDDTAINAQEETVLNADTVSKGIIIEGAEKIQGNPPTPNGAINFELDYDKQSAFLKNGFDINFKTTDNYAGAYIQLKSEDDKIASEYIKVPRFAFKRSSKKSVHGLAKKSAKMDETTFGIDVDFANNVPPGKFCYIICVYDEDNNIALPQEVCVEIEAWGGNSSIAGTWNYTKYEGFENGNLTDSETVGVEDCSDAEYYCSATQESQTLENRDCYTTNSLILVLNANGTFRYDDNYDSEYLDYQASDNNDTDCTPKFITKEGAIDYGKGNWAYNEDTKELTLVEFEYSEDGEIGFLEEGEVFEGTATVSGNSMIFEFSENYTSSNGETTAYNDKSYFVR